MQCIDDELCEDILFEYLEKDEQEYHYIVGQYMSRYLSDAITPTLQVLMESDVPSTYHRGRQILCLTRRRLLILELSIFRPRTTRVVTLNFEDILDPRIRPIRDVVIKDDEIYGVLFSFSLHDGTEPQAFFPRKIAGLENQKENIDRFLRFFGSIAKRERKRFFVQDGDQPAKKKSDSRISEEIIDDWSDPETDGGCEAFGEYEKDDGNCAACRDSTPGMAKLCIEISKRPSEEEKYEWRDPETDEGCEAFGNEYDQSDGNCAACCEDTPRIWFWCRKYSIKEEEFVRDVTFR